MVRPLVFCFICCFALAAALLNITPVKISVDNIAIAGPLASWATANDLITGFIADTTSTVNVSLGVFKQGTNGQVTKIASHPFTVAGQEVFTNGQWFAGQKDADLTLFRLDSGNNPTDILNVPYFGLLMVPDGSMLAYDKNSLSIQMLQLSDISWSPVGQTISANLTFQFGILPVWASNQTLIFHEATGLISFYSRDNDGSWIFDSSYDSQSVPEGEYSLSYNGVDTVFLVAPVALYPGATKYGHLLILTKVNDDWIRTVITMDDLPVTNPYSYPGYNSYGVVNPNVFVAGTPYDAYPTENKRGSLQPVPIGSMFFFQRKVDNTWEAVAKAKLDAPGFFGAPALVTSSHVVSVLSATQSNLGYDTTFYGIPTCTFDPIDVTCVNGSSLSCANFDPLTVGAYTINNPDCGEVNTTVTELDSDGSTYTITFKFDKGSIATATCTSTWSCPSTPGNNNTPSATTTPNKKTSSASAISSVGAVVLILALAWF